MSGIELDMVYMLKNEIVVNLNVGTLNAKYDLSHMILQVMELLITMNIIYLYQEPLT